MKNLKPYIVSILVALGVGALSALFTMDYSGIYQTLMRPALSPPAFVFPVVWAILYVLMGIGSARVYIEGKFGSNCTNAIRVYVLQLVFNFFWSIIFFRFRLVLLGFVWILALIFLVVLMIILFAKCDKIAAYLQLPYLVWLLFAAYLNLMIYILN